MIRLTRGVSSENVPVMLLWTEVGDPSFTGEGIEGARRAVPVSAGSVPQSAQVRVTRTDTGGRFVHYLTTGGAVTLRLGTLPANCRQPADRTLAIEVGEVSQIHLDVMCTVPKPTAIP